MVSEKGSRKVRSDKKREVQPTISIHLKEAIYRLSYITNTPVKDVAERICTDGLLSRKVMELLSEKIRRSLSLGKTLYLGDLSRPSIQRMQSSGVTERIGIRFKAHDYENLTALAYALDVTPSRATAILLDTSIRNSDFLNEYFHEHLQERLDNRRLNELKAVLKYLNANNPYEERISWGLLLSYIYEELKEGTSTLTDSISEMISKWKDGTN